MERVEIGDTVHAQDDGLAVDDEPLLAYLPGSLDDPTIAVGPVVTAARNQAHMIPVAFQAEAVAVVLHFVEPLWAVRDYLRPDWQAELEQASKIGVQGTANQTA